MHAIKHKLSRSIFVSLVYTSKLQIYEFHSRYFFERHVGLHQVPIRKKEAPIFDEKTPTKGEITSLEGNFLIGPPNAWITTSLHKLLVAFIRYEFESLRVLLNLCV